MDEAQALGDETDAAERLEQHPQPFGTEHKGRLAAGVQDKGRRDRDLLDRAADVLPGGALFGRRGGRAGVSAEVRRIADDVIHAAVGQERAHMAQVAVQRCDVFEPVALDRAAEQVERVLLYLQTGHGEVLAPAE